MNDKAKNLTDVIFTREKSDLLNAKADQLEWRRSKVVEMRARGMTHRQIAHEYEHLIWLPSVDCKYNMLQH
jgi:hypothetical protein